MTNPSPFKRAIVILADGARPDVLKEEMAKGLMPHLSRLCENGTNQTMLTCFPSTTGPAYLPYVTGCFPGTCNVPGIRWFDKPRYAKKGWGFGSFRSYCGLETSLFNSDVEPKIKSAWEIFPHSKSIFNGVTMGLPKSGDLTRNIRTWYYYYAHLTDRWSFIDDKAFRLMRDTIRKRDFDFSFMVFPSIDEFSHRSSVTHERVRKAYHDIDALVGGLIKELQQAGIADETLIALVSDHGLSDTHTHFDIGPWLETQKKLKTFYYSNIFKFRFDAVSMISGNGMANLYFRGAAGWKDRMSFEEISHRSLLLDELRFHPSVDLVVTQGADGAIHFQTERGHGLFRVSTQDQLIRYQFERDDPLGIFQKNDPDVAVAMSFDRALERSWDSHYPDVFMQMHQLFRSQRTGDVIVSARTGHDLRIKFEHPLHKASHGSICPEHMRVPLLMNQKISLPHARSVDVFPTILKLLGKEIPQGIDGRCLV